MRTTLSSSALTLTEFSGKFDHGSVAVHLVFTEILQVCVKLGIENMHQSPDATVRKNNFN